MPRNKKLKGQAKKEKKGTTVLIQLDPESAYIYKQQKKFRNMSEWFRVQLKYHFGSDMSLYQQLELLKEEYQTLYTDLDRKKAALDRDYKGRGYAIGERIMQLQNKIKSMEGQEEGFIYESQQCTR